MILLLLNEVVISLITETLIHSVIAVFKENYLIYRKALRFTVLEINTITCRSADPYVTELCSK